MIRIYLTGRIAVEVEGEIVLREAQFRGRQERLAFAYMVCARARTIPREELAMLLWPEGSPPAWSTALSAVVSRLRTLLASDALSNEGVEITRGFGQHQMVLPPDTWVDLEAASYAIDAAEGALRAGEPKRAFGPATVAATIARRPFLSGDESAWARREREKLERQRVRALECQAEVWLANGEPPLAVEAAQEALTIEPFRESAYRLLMRSHALAGNRAEGVLAYHDLRSRLVSELGTDPSKETEAVYLELLA
ncbi:MAG: DNA-binding protein [Chloroflexi bacterium]|nr:DNA-binding protein [Chloroflexota bacterium]